LTTEGTPHVVSEKRSLTTGGLIEGSISLISFFVALESRRLLDGIDTSMGFLSPDKRAVTYTD
jgi:hypothetical protein